MKALGLFAFPVLAVLALLFGVVVVLAPAGNGPVLAATNLGCLPQPTDSVAGIHLDARQRQVARTVIAVGRSLHVPSTGWAVALATAMQESGLRPLPFGDRDSLGVFQQRTTWGPVAQRMDPRASARMFFTGGHDGQRGLLDIPGWQRMSLTRAAQAVQASAYPDAYAKWRPLAVQLVQQLAHVHAGDCASNTGWVFPLGAAPKILTAGFGACGSLWAHCHTGQDFAAPIGTPVAAAGNGIVIFADWAGAYGNLVEILHPGGIGTWYAHLSRIDVRTGAHVHAGQLIGLVGQTGNTTGPHLHFEVHLHASAATAGTPIDPLPWLRNHHLM